MGEGEVLVLSEADRAAVGTVFEQLAADTTPDIREFVFRAVAPFPSSSSRPGSGRWSNLKGFFIVNNLVLSKLHIACLRDSPSTNFALRALFLRTRLFCNFLFIRF